MIRGRKPNGSWLVAGAMILALLVSAPVFASDDDDGGPTLCAPEEPVTDTTAPLAPEVTVGGPDTSVPGEPDCLPACNPDGSTPVPAGAPVDPLAPAATETTVDPTLESTTTTVAEPVQADAAEATTTTVADTTTTVTAPPVDEPTCIVVEEPVAEDPTAGEPAADTLTPPVADPAAPVDEAVAVEPIIDPAPEVPEIPETPEEGWPVRPITFPVYGPVRYDDDWGNCRGGPECPRRHVGNDIVGSRLQPLVAAADGTVTHIVRNHRTAGWGLVITDAEGWDYRYYHVNNDTPGSDDGADDGTWRFVEGIEEGTEVHAGQVVAFMGDSGNSEHSVPHLHFEIHQPDGSAIDPFRSLHLAEWVARCSGASDPYADLLAPVPYPDSATQEVPVAFGDGAFYVGTDGAWASTGDARTSGDTRHVTGTPSCDTLDDASGDPGDEDSSADDPDR